MSAASQAAQLHYWSLTKKKIGTKFLGLDRAGNVLLFPAYRTSWFGGWFPVTLAYENLRKGTLFLEDGHPMHHKSSKKLQYLVLAKQKEREQLVVKNLEEKIRASLKEASEATTTEANTEKAGESQTEGGSPSPSQKPKPETPEVLDEAQYLTNVLKDFSKDRFMKKYLRVNRLVTWTYLFVYWSLWAAAGYVTLCAYWAFKGWLNPPARRGLNNIETKLLYYPNCLIELFDEYLLAPIEGTELGRQLIDCVKERVAAAKDSISPYFASWEIRWAKHHEKQLKAKEHEMELLKLARERDEQRKLWWERSLISLLLAIITICFM